jgi:hypothetical protein
MRGLADIRVTSGIPGSTTLFDLGPDSSYLVPGPVRESWQLSTLFITFMADTKA